jgi:hypothetical protein
MHRCRPELEALEARTLPSAVPAVDPVPGSSLYQSWDPATGALHQFYVQDGTWHFQTQADGAPSVWVDRAVTSDQQAALDAVYAQGGLLAVFGQLHQLADAPIPAPTATVDVTLSAQTQLVRLAAGQVVNVLPAPVPAAPPPYVPPTPQQAFDQTVQDIAASITVSAGESAAQAAASYPFLASISPDAFAAAFATAFLLKEQQEH